MSKTNKAKSLKHIIRMFIIIITISFVFLISLYTFISYSNLQKAVKKMRTDYMEQQKYIAKNRVMSVVKMINYYTSTSKQQAMDKVKKRTYEAYLIAKSIYENNKDTMSKEEIENLVKEALRPIRFQNGRGYYFATRLDGIEQLFADKPQLEGKNFINFKDKNGKYVVKDMIKLVQTKKEGFYSYYWTKPGYKNKKFLKISYIKLFEPFDWLIGTGLYVDDIEKEQKEYIIKQVNAIKFKKGGYIFINRYDGYAIISNGKIVNAKKKLWETNPKAKSVFEKELNAAKKGGGFIRYKWPKMGNTKEYIDKISYIYGIKKWHWIIGSGVYVNDIEKSIAVMKKELINQTKKQFALIVLIIIIVAAAVMVLFGRIHNELSDNFNKITTLFKTSVIEDKKIDVDRFDFEELKQLASNMNSVLDSKTEMQNNYEDDFIKSFVHIMEARDIYTKGHSQRVAFYASQMASALGLDSKTKEDIYKAGLLHDIGKIGIPDNILLKPGKLTKSEYNIIKYHSIFSYEMLKRLKHFQHLADCVRQHHERCDGSGYPDGLKCKEITLCGKILAIADIFDALTTTRPYRKAFGIQKAMEILRKENIDQDLLSKVEDILVDSLKLESDTEILFMSEEITKVRDEIFNIDYMTGLRRKKTIPEKAQTLIEKNIPFALFMIDIKNISKINYKYSIETGDKLIVYSAEACRELLEANGFDNTNSLARAYNDAFLFIHRLDKNKKIDLDSMSEKIRILMNEFVSKQFRENDENTANDIIKDIDFYISYAVYPDESTNINKLIQLCSIKKDKRSKNDRTYS